MDKSEPVARLRELLIAGWRVDTTLCPAAKDRINGFRFLWRLALGLDRLHLFF